MNSVIVDSCVILDVFTADPVFYDRSAGLLSRLALTHRLCVNDVIYSEVSIGFTRIETLDECLKGLGFEYLSIPREALFLAEKAFLAYRKRGGTKTGVLPDFFIGAHGAISGLAVVTRDPSRMRHSFPRLPIFEP